MAYELRFLKWIYIVEAQSLEALQLCAFREKNCNCLSRPDHNACMQLSLLVATIGTSVE
jgi:hypothetical protein